MQVSSSQTPLLAITYAPSSTEEKVMDHNSTLDGSLIGSCGQTRPLEGIGVDIAV